MIFRRMQCIKEIPTSCTTCPLYPMECGLPLENGYLKDGLDSHRDERCSLIERTEKDIDFCLCHVRKNREDSQSLSEIPTQRWKEAHKSEVLMMDAIISRLENTLRVLQINELNIEANENEESADNE